MSDKKSNTRTVEAVLRVLDRDVLYMAEELLVAELDPGHEQRAAQAVTRLRAKLREHKRDSLRQRAEARKQTAERLIAASTDWIRRRMQELVEAGDPQVQMAFRGRSPGAMTEEELRSIAEDHALLDLLGENDNE